MKTITLGCIAILSLLFMPRHADTAAIISMPEAAITNRPCMGPYALEPAPPKAPEPDDSTLHGPHNDHRWRLQLGGIFLSGGDLINAAIFPLINLNYRWSWDLTSGTSTLATGPMLEIGTIYLIPYMKGGMELRVANLFFDIHAGGILGGWDGGHGPALSVYPLGGANIGYMFALGSMRMETETGFDLMASHGPWGMGHLTLGFLW